jgi:hypothetical protein
MKIIVAVVGALLVFLGGVWALQGLNILGGSYMSGNMQWVIIGGIAFIGGVLLLVFDLVRRPSKSAK